MARRKDADLGVHWFLPDASRPFMSTTPATSFLIEVIAADGHTVDEAVTVVRYDDDAKRVLRTLSEAGHGRRPLAELVCPV